MDSHPKHLNTPRLVADAAGTTVWKWEQAEPFGDSPADENPSGLDVFDLPLRLPGQVNDKESGLAQNWFRDYDKSLGRYPQSDPIGIYGGLGTYSYGALNPLTYSDRTGEWVWVAAGAGIGAVGNVLITYGWNAYNGKPTTSNQLLAAATSGAIAGTYGALGGPLGGTVARWLGTKANGAIGVVGGALFSGAGGYVGQVAANYIDPCNPGDPWSAAIWAGAGGAFAGAMIPTPGMYTISQATHFQPQAFPAINRSPVVRSHATSTGLSMGSVFGWPISPPACTCKPSPQ